MPRKIQRATEIDYDLVPYPLLGTPKFDGIHLHNRSDGFYTREGLRVPNCNVRELLKAPLNYLNSCGAELEFEFLVDGQDFNSLSGTFRAHSEVVNAITIVGLDVYNDKMARYRYKTLERICKEMAELRFPGVTVMWVVPQLLKTPAAARAYAKECLSLYEGAVFRGASSYYKEGVSTLNEAAFLRDKGLTHYNGEILWFIQSTDKNGVPKNMCHSAKVWCSELNTHVTVSMTKNLTDDDRIDFLVNPSDYEGRILEFVCNYTEGMEVRGPRFKRWRTDLW